MQKSVYLVTIFIFLSGCSWVSFIDSRGIASVVELTPISAVTQNKLNEPVPISISGGIPPYTLELISGSATIDSTAKTITSLIAGTVSVKITDSSGQSKTVNFDFNGNQTIVSALTTVYKVSSDFSKVFFLKADGSGNNELYKSNADATEVVKLVGTGTPVGSYTFKSVATTGTTIELTPNEQYIVFRGSDTINVTRLYVIKTDGTGLRQLSADYTTVLMYVRSFKVISNTKVSYTDAEQEDSGDPEPWMRVVNIDGTGRQLIHPDLGGNNDEKQVVNFKYSQDLSKVFYFTEFIGTIYTSLFVSNTDGSSNGSMTRISPVGIDFFSGQSSLTPISPDGNKLMVTNYVNLYLCNTDGSGCPVSYAGSFSVGQFSYDNAYFLASETSGQYLLKVSSSQSVNIGATNFSYRLINGSNFVYRASTFATGGTISRTALSTAGAASWTQLNPVFPGFSNVTSMTVSDDNLKIYFLVDDQSNYVYRLYRMNLDGSSPEVINNVSFDLTGATSTIPAINKISTNQERALIVVGNDLHMVNLVSGGSTKLTDRAQLTSTISNINVFDDVRKIFYRSNQNSLSITELFRILSPF